MSVNESNHEDLRLWSEKVGEEIRALETQAAPERERLLLLQFARIGIAAEIRDWPLRHPGA